MDRAELYRLVWEKPMTQVAKEFGISDVGLRKICVKHHVPTPPLGYWAKLAHGKPVKRPPLPTLEDGAREHVHLVARPMVETPENVRRVELEARTFELRPENKIVVPTERPNILHPVAAAVEKALRKSKASSDGLLTCNEPNLPEVKIGAASVERAVIIIDTFAKALVSRGHRIGRQMGTSNIVIQGETFHLAIYETLEKTEHQPTREDHTRQAEYDEKRKRYPTLYRAKQVWAKYDYSASGRLCLELSDPSQFKWNGEHIVGRWRDRGAKPIEDSLGSAIIALTTAASLVKHRRAEAEARAKAQAEAMESRRREEKRRQRANERHQFLTSKADEFARFTTLVRFERFLAANTLQDSSEPFDKMAQTLKILVDETAQSFQRYQLNKEIIERELFGDDDNESPSA